ncbi:MAG: hypothetical protein NT098_00665 [Candidatus Parcubacteria bacterium]|nr:hypothetical protein [Candidatus Parcubacteria bacterium]
MLRNLKAWNDATARVIIKNMKKQNKENEKEIIVFQNRSGAIEFKGDWRSPYPARWGGNRVGKSENPRFSDIIATWVSLEAITAYMIRTTISSFR